MRIIEVEQGSESWHIERFGNVTGTRFQSAIGAKFSIRNGWTMGDEKVMKTLMYEIVSERMSANEIIELNTPAVLRGNELEPFAIKAASKKRGVAFTTCGMIVSDFDEGIRFSPDAILMDGDNLVGGLECKCPSGKKHIEYMLGDEVPKEYYWQVLSPFICVDSVQWWDFASYDDRNYERELFMHRVYRKDVEHIVQPAREQLDKFLTMCNEAHESLTF